MTNIRLLPVVVMAISALLVLKTLGLVTNGGYVLTGVTSAFAAGASSSGSAGAPPEGGDPTVTLPTEPTLSDTTPTLSDVSPTLGAPAAAQAAGSHGAPAAAADAAAGHGAPAEAAAPAGEHAAPAVPSVAGAPSVSSTYCIEPNATLTETGEVVLPREGIVAAEPAPVPEGSFAKAMATDCLPSGDVVPTELGPKGEHVPLVLPAGASITEQQLLERLASRRGELKQFEDDLALRASIVDAAEKRIEERAATLEALEAQISSLVDQRQEMEKGQFAGIVAMYEAMRPKDAATIFNNLDMEVLLRVAKTMSPRKMAPILAQMSAPRAQELTVRMAAIADKPPAVEMTAGDFAALPQIVGQ